MVKIFYLVGMDKPTSEKDLIKSLPPDPDKKSFVAKSMDDARLREHYDKGVSASAKAIKPVFDKMLAALRGIPYEALLLFSEERSRAIVEAIKEAEELGL